jgi:hypothetical protein
LFKGKDSADQMRLIILSRGYPSEAFITTLQNPYSTQFLRRFQEYQPRALELLLPTASEQGRQFFDYLLNYGLLILC